MQWVRDKFGVELPIEDVLIDEQSQTARIPNEIIDRIETRARQAYARRELEYSADQVLTYAFSSPTGPMDNAYAGDFIADWAWKKYRLKISPTDVTIANAVALRQQFVEQQEYYLRKGGVEKTVDELIVSNPDVEALRLAVNDRLDVKLTARDFQVKTEASSGQTVMQPATPAQIKEMLLTRMRQFIRRELSDLEQFILIQILDQSWKDHLYAMDMLKASVGLIAFAEQDPRVQYKKEGFRYFQEMMIAVRDKTTDLLFRARTVGTAQTRSAYRETAAVHESTGGYGVTENVAATAAAVETPTAHSSGEMQAASEQPQGEASKVKQIVRETERVGRNDLCPCGSGKKYKKCHGINAA